MMVQWYNDIMIIGSRVGLRPWGVRGLPAPRGGPLGGPPAGWLDPAVQYAGPDAGSAGPRGSWGCRAREVDPAATHVARREQAPIFS